MDLSFGLPAVQATIARLRSLSMGQRVSPEQEGQDHQTQTSRSEATPLGLSSTLHDAAPSLSFGVPDAPDHTSLLRGSNSGPEAHLVPLHESPSEWPAAVADMDISQEGPDDSPAITSSTSLSSGRAGRADPTEADATLPSEDKPDDTSAPSRKSERIENHIDVLQKLAKDRMTVMGLRSDAQEHGKAMRRLYKQFKDDTSVILAALKEHKSGEVSTASAPSSDQVDAFVSLLDSIEEARKMFHKSQERLLNVEWSMKEREDRLYAQYGLINSPFSVNDLSDSLSDPASLTLRPTFDEDQLVSIFAGQVAPPIQYGAPVFRGSEGNIEYELKDALVEPGVFSSTTLRNDYNEPVRRLPSQYSNNNSSNLKHVELEDIVSPVRSAVDQSVQELASRGRISQYSRTRTAELRSRQYNDKQHQAEFSYLGSWFDDDPKYPFPTKHNPIKEIVPTSEYVPTSAYTVSGTPKRPAYGVPWSSFTAGGRHFPYPGGMDAIQGVTAKNLELIALGLPITEQLNHIRVLVDEDVRTTRSLMLHDWLWEPNVNARFDSLSDTVPTIRRPDPHAQKFEFDRSIRTTSEESPDSGEVKRVRSEPVTPHTTTTVRSDLAHPRHSSEKDFSCDRHVI